MKKILTALLLAFMLTFGLVGCDSFAKNERAKINPDADISAGKKISILLPYVSEKMKENPAIPLLEQLTGYKATYEQLPAGSAAETELTTLFVSKKTDYDAIKLTKNQFNKFAVRAAELADMTDVVNSPKFSVLKNAIKPEAWESVTYDGKILGIPDSSSNDNIDKSIIIRKDLLLKLTNSKTGQLYTDVPETFADFKQMLIDFKNANPNNNTAFTLPKNIEIVGPIAASFGVEQLWQDIDGELKFIAENPKLTDYISAMKELASAGVLDMEMQNNSFANCSDKFIEGKSIATVSNFWEMATVANSLRNNSKVPEDCVTYAYGFNNADNVKKTWQSGGCTYVTVVPNWLASSGTYVMDYIQKKITDDNFIELVAGKEDSEYKKDPVKNEFYPLEGFSAKKLSADHFVTGTNDNVYPTYWTQVVIKGVNDYYFQWNNTNTRAFARGLIGVKNPLAFAPPFPTFSTAAAGIEDDFYGLAKRAIYGSDGTTADTIKNKFQNADTQTKVKEVKDWYKNK